MTDDLKTSKTTQVRERMEEAAEAVTETARSEADKMTAQATGQAGDTVQNAADAASAAAHEFDAGSLQEQAAAQLSSHLQSVATNLRATDLESAATRVSAFARENPALFLGGAALLGFAAARFLKSSDRGMSYRPADVDEDPWMGHVTATPSASEPMPVAANAAPYTNGRAQG